MEGGGKEPKAIFDNLIQSKGRLDLGTAGRWCGSEQRPTRLQKRREEKRREKQTFELDKSFLICYNGKRGREQSVLPLIFWDDFSEKTRCTTFAF